MITDSEDVELSSLRARLLVGEISVIEYTNETTVLLNDSWKRTPASAYPSVHDTYEYAVNNTPASEIEGVQRYLKAVQEWKEANK